MLESEKSFLRSMVAKIEKLELDKALLSEHILNIYTDLKNEGYDVKVIKKVIRLRKTDEEKIAQEQELMDLYQHAFKVSSKLFISSEDESFAS